jgi:hypothetical protein
MDGLVMSGRTGKRQGFPKDIAEALLRLASLHERRFPTKAKETEKVDIWDPWS